MTSHRALALSVAIDAVESSADGKPDAMHRQADKDYQGAETSAECSQCVIS